ncbi:beta-propeller domain-containing protein [Sorangium sp. So ce1036]|uniref:beta-propeller domain-containing protein n=1 Tax=Sorangium sp. So ce1036 TaxID=3133328 RepID=UPI003F02C446
MRSLLGTYTLLSLLAVGCGVAACSLRAGEPTPAPGPTPTPTARVISALTPARGCEEVEALLRERLKQTMIASVDRMRSNALRSLENGCAPPALEGGLGAAAGGVGAGGGVAPAPVDEAAGGGGEAAAAYSTTNTQEAGVDEADFIKNDGEHIYLLAHGALQIVDAWPAADAHRVASVPIRGVPRKLFVHGERALVYSSLVPAQNDFIVETSGAECAYGYDCELTGDGAPLLVTELDLGDLAAPVVTRTLEFSGSFINARRVGDVVHTVVSSPEPVLANLRSWPEGLSLCAMAEGGSSPAAEQTVSDAFDALIEENLALIDAASFEDMMPTVRDTPYRDGVAQPRRADPFAGCDGYYLSNTGDGHRFLSVVSTELGGEGLGQVTIVGKPGVVYATSTSLYVASRHQYGQTSGWFYDDGAKTPDATTIHEFALSDSASPSAYLGSGVVKGRVLNQLALSEHDGYLRVATTTGRLPDPDTHNTVASLKQEGGELVVKGMVDHLARGEDIRSARFYGDVGFVVTFKKTDPLFTLDLSDPGSPRVRGELEIPGFSTYMHMIDAGHLMSIGYDADDQGDFGWFQGVMLQIFDVTDLDAPRLAHKEVIGTRGSASDAATHHLAFNYFAQRGLLGIPMVVCEGGSGGSSGDTMTFSGLLVYEVDVGGGFTSVGGVPHPLPDTSSSPVNAGCRSWWTDARSFVKRSVFMEDHVYSVSEDEIRVAHLGDLETPAAIVSLTP